MTEIDSLTADFVAPVLLRCNSELRAELGRMKEETKKLREALRGIRATVVHLQLLTVGNVNTLADRVVADADAALGERKGEEK